MSSQMSTSLSTTELDCCLCLKVIKWTPVIFILIIVVWSYYSYVVELCLYTVETTVQQVIYLTVYHILFIMFMWSYYQTTITKNTNIADKFKLPDKVYEELTHTEDSAIQRLILEQFAKKLPNVNRTASGSVRYCEKCQIVKPDRAHHCSVCQACVLKMDHHCPWINNCIGFNNYKFFVLYLLYSLLYCLYISGTTMKYVVLYWHGGKFLILFLFFASLMFAISLISLFCYHCYLVLHNRTTLEALRAPVFASGPDKEGFDLGKKNNFLEIFGNSPELWLIPVKTHLGNGYNFPHKCVAEDSEYLLRSIVYDGDETARSNGSY